MDGYLKQAFKENISSLLQEQADAFFASYDKPAVRSLRVNTLKPVDLGVLFPGTEFTPVPWCSDSFYYPPSFSAGKTAAHLAGAYYVQEASATFPVTALDVKPGDKVLDLCAAPGGKSTQIAAALKGEGLLVANEIVPSRASALSQNIERLGVKNAVVLNHDPRDLENRFTGYFDKILVDAPCSGEGMFRKSPEAAREWTPDSPALCAARQAEILATAINMLKPGGTLVYSTCTLNATENEELVARVLAAHADIQLYPIKTLIPQPVLHGVKASDAVVEGTVRIMPHLADGEGHFCARFLRTDGVQVRVKPLKPTKNGAFDKAFSEFCSRYLNVLPVANTFFGEYGYSAPVDCPDLDRLRVLRAGVQLGRLTKGRFEPSHSLALALNADETKNSLSFGEGAKELTAYLGGGTLPCDLDGWATVCVNDLPLGWGKASGGVLKNHLPKGLRINR